MDLEKEIEQLIDRSLAEDIRSGDITSLACLSDCRYTTGMMFLKQSGIVAGLPLLALLFCKLNPQSEVTLMVPEGSFQKAGTQIAKVSGSAPAILSGERIALNLLQHACGVATITQAYVKKISGIKCDILDSRRTIPGLRALQKYAVAVGGGKNHRNGLDDCFVIKSTHLAFLPGSEHGSITQAIDRVKNYSPETPIEVQIDDIKDIEEAVKHDIRAIIFRNMSTEELSESVSLIRKTNKKIYLAFSGDVVLETVRDFAETGVNGICVSALTHSVQDIDIRMSLK